MGLLSTSPTPLDITGDTAARIDTLADETGVTDDLYRVTPYRGTPGREVGTRFLDTLYSGWVDGDSSRLPWRSGGAPTFAFEAWAQNQTIRFVFRSPSRDLLADPLSATYDTTSIEPHTDAFLELNEGECLFGARAALAEDCIFPTPTGETKVTAFGADPLADVLPRLTGAREEQALLQVLYRPVSTSWYERGRLLDGGDDIATSVGQGRSVGEINPRVVKMDRDSDAKSDIEAQANRPAFQTILRVFATAPWPDVAVRRVEAVTNALGVFDWEVHPGTVEQSFEPTLLSGRALTSELDAAIRRRLPRQGRLARAIHGPQDVLTDEQLAELVHLPAPDAGVTEIEYETTGDVGTAPAEAPAFDEFDETGYSDGDLSEPL